MNPFEMVVAIIVVVTIGRVLSARYGIGRDRHGRDFRLNDPALQQENARLREELDGLKKRMAVLERLATEDDNSSARLDREIEKLRDRT